LIKDIYHTIRILVAKATLEKAGHGH